MSYQRLSKPRFYTDNINWQFARGLSRDTAITVTGSFVSGFDKYQLFDMDPLNYAEFDVGGTSNKVSILIDFEVAVECSCLAVLNHDLDTQGGNIRIAYSSASMSPGGGTTVLGLTSNYNGNVTGSYPNTVSQPQADGDTVLTFTAQSARYWLIEFDDVAAASWAGDPKFGQISLGKHWTSPVSPDMPVTKSTAHEGVKRRKAYGGKGFGFASHVLPNTGDYTPFRFDTQEKKSSGREAFNFSLSFMEDDNIYPADRADMDASDNFLADVIDKVYTNLYPLVFQIDSESTTEGDFVWGYLDIPSFDTTRKAWQSESFNLRVVQEF